MRAHGEAIYRFQDGMLPTILPPERRLSFRRTHRHSLERHRCRQHDVGLDYPHSESTFPPIGKILAEIWRGAGDRTGQDRRRNTAAVYNLRGG